MAARISFAGVFLLYHILGSRKLQNCGNSFIFPRLNIEIRKDILTSVNDEVFCHFERENMFKPKLLGGDICI